jgi:cytochrome c-type biogenesis protein CcmH
MRAAIREQLQSGRSEQDVIQYFEQRYGAQIVWSPPWRGFSLFAWLVPIAFLLCGVGLVMLLLREWCSTTKDIGKDIVGAGLATVHHVERQPLDDNLERYRAQLEAELAADDALFRKTVGRGL